jgi:hypothetical protein
MKKKNHRLRFAVILIFVFTAFSSFAQTSKKTEWDIPDEYKKMKNPINPNYALENFKGNRT